MKIESRKRVSNMQWFSASLLCGWVCCASANPFNPNLSLILDGVYKSENTALFENEKGFGLGHTELTMQDAIDDYLQDPDVDARRCYEEMLSCVEDVIKYHKKELNKASELYNLMLGNRRYDMNKPAKPASVGSTTNNEDGTKSYGYAASVTMSDIYKFQRGNSL